VYPSYGEIFLDRSPLRSMDDSLEVDRAIHPQFYETIAKKINILYAKSPRKASVK
jgi:hypothetical protein